MKTIFLIGNGFDLAHELKTTYSAFLKSLSVDIVNNNTLLFILSRNKLKCWSDIEYTYFTLLNNCEDAMYINKKFGIRIRNFTSETLDNDFEEIKTLLEKYLFEEQENIVLIDAYSKLFSKLDDEDTLILDFNYTNTIERYLEKTHSKIKHIKIHGELLNDDNPIVFGYAANDEEAKILSYKNDEYLMKNIKKLRYLLADNEFKFKEMLGMSNFIIDVYNLGHSCGLSDRHILNELFTHKKVYSITQLYYENRDEYLKTAINIDRVIDDYSQNEKKNKSFGKLNIFKKSTPMIQKYSVDDEIETFLKYVESIRIKYGNKRAQSGSII